MQRSPNEDYERYLEHRALTSADTAPLTQSEFESLMRRLDELVFGDLERHVSSEEHRQLKDLARLLGQELGEDLGAIEEPKIERSRPKTSRLGSPRPDARKRRDAWRMRRRQGG